MMPLQWSMATYLLATGRVKECIMMITTLCHPKLPTSPPKGNPHLPSPARVAVCARLPNTTPSSNMSRSILEAKGCALLLNLSRNTLQCHSASSHHEVAAGCQKGVTVAPSETLTAVLSGLKQCLWGTKSGKYCFSKSIKNKPPMYCKNTCSSNTCPYAQTKETQHNQQ